MCRMWLTKCIHKSLILSLRLPRNKQLILMNIVLDDAFDKGKWRWRAVAGLPRAAVAGGCHSGDADEATH